MDEEDGFRTQRPQDKPSDDLLLTTARDHLGLLIPIIGALIFAFRCIIISDDDPYVTPCWHLERV